MILGLSLQTFTLLHVAISLIAIVTGLVVVIGMLGSQWLCRLDRAFPRHHRVDQPDRLSVSG